MRCTYCKTELQYRTPKTTRRAGIKILRLECPSCGELFLATDGEYSHPYQTHPRRLDTLDIKRVRSFRASDREMMLVENGELRLTVRDKRITIAV
jgi:hypothetical protein